MKKIILIVLLAGWVFGGYAQEVKFGVKAGMNMTSLGSDFKDLIDGFDQELLKTFTFNRDFIIVTKV